MKNSRAIFLLLLANSISGVAQGISMLAIPWYFTGVIHQEGLFGKAYFVTTALSLFWGVYAGTLIDRYDRKRIFLVMNLAGLFILSSVTLIGFKNDSLPWYLVAFIFCTTVFIYNIHFPNLYAFAQEITAKEDYGRVTSLLEIQGQITFTIAGGLAAILLTGIQNHFSVFGFHMALPFNFQAWKIHEIFAIDAFTYLIAFAIIYRIKSLPIAEKKTDTTQLRERLKTGLIFLRKHPLLLHFGNASLLVFLTVLIFGTYVQPSYVNRFLQKGGDVFALGDMAFSMGAVIAGFITTRLFSESKAVFSIIMLSIISGCMYLVMALNNVVYLYFAANFVIGACNAAIRIQRITYLFHHIPNHVIGRANSILFVISVFLRLCLIGTFSLAFFHQGVNVVYAVGTMAVVCFAGAAILWANYQKLIKQPDVV
ncbi:MAG TPA: MFS transporter [Chitinophagales bacterium]|nr:MFS transporter [Chitinophagales bacterium]